MVGDVALNANLDTFFPFDPYRLKKSQSWIDPIYREWASVAIDDDDEEEDSDEDAEEEHTTQAKSEDETSKGLGESFEQMSISPDKFGLIISGQ
jgi:RNA polymerase I-specific transcription initiation factor RRN3